MSIKFGPLIIIQYLEVGNEYTGARLGMLPLDDHDAQTGVSLLQGHLAEPLVLPAHKSKVRN